MNNDTIITAHVLERFEERFPDIYESDEQVAHLINEEVMDALVEGRSSHVAPIELSHFDPERWMSNGQAVIAWVADKSRGYVLLESWEGLIVATVLKGRPKDEARQWLYKGRAARKETNGTTAHAEDADAPGVGEASAASETQH